MTRARTKLGLTCIAVAWPLFVVGAIETVRSPDFCDALPAESHAVHIADHLDIAGGALVAIGVGLALWGGGPSMHRLHFRWAVLVLAFMTACAWVGAAEIALAIHDPFVLNGVACPTLP